MKPFSMCCSELVANGWDGSFEVEVIAILPPFTVSVTLPQNTGLLPMASFLGGIPVEVTCDGEVLTCSEGCPTNVFSTSDPLYSFWSKSIRNHIGDVPVMELPTIPNTLTTIFWVSTILPGHKKGAKSFGLGDAIKDGSSWNSKCTVSYSGLVSNGVPLDLTLTDLQESVPVCNASEYLMYKAGFRNAIAFLDDPSIKSIASSLAVVNLGMTYTESITWIACKNLATSFLNKSSEKLLEETTDCLQHLGTPEYDEDPCCNTELQLTQCCATQAWESDISVYTFDEDFMNRESDEECKVTLCLEQPLTSLDYMFNSALDKECENDRIVALNDKELSINPFLSCVGHVYETACYSSGQCGSISSTSECHDNKCTIPCNEGACYSGVCESHPLYGDICVDLATDETSQAEALSNCTLDKLESNIKLLVAQNIENSYEDGTFSEKFMKAVSEFQCLGDGGNVWHGINNEEECTQATGYCPWRVCWVDDSAPDVFVAGKCTTELCFAGVPAEEYFCAYQSLPGLISIPIGNPDLCEIRLHDTEDLYIELDEDFCLDNGGIWAGPDSISLRSYGACYIKDLTESDCFPEWCIDGYKDERCHSYCMTSEVEGNCSGTWKTWTANGPQAACVVEMNLEACDASAYTWKAGRNWIPAFLNSQAECESTPACLEANLIRYGLSESECVNYQCSSCYTGDEESCNSKEACLRTSACDAPEGCKLPHEIMGLYDFGFDCTWNPESCVVAWQETACVSTFGAEAYQPRGAYQTPESCEAALRICREDPNATFENAEELPEGFSIKNEEECEKCGGEMIPFWKWRQAEWKSESNLVNLKWTKKELLYPSWINSVSSHKWDAILEKARSQYLTSILASEMYCDYGVEAELVAIISSLCQGFKYESRSLPIGAFTACNAIAGEYSVGSVTFSYDSDFTVPVVTTQVPCVKSLVSTMPKSTFDSSYLKVASSLALQCETTTSREMFYFVYNENGAVVGQVVGDGYEVETTVESSGMNMCFTIPEVVDWELNHPLHVWDLATIDVSPEGTIVFTPIGLNIPIEDRVVCQEIKGNVTFFPIGLVEDFEGVTIANSWSQDERGLMIFCVIAYLICFIYASASLEARLRKGKYKHVSQAEASLFCIMILTGLGTTYILMVLTGYYVGTNLDPLLTDLPALMLLTCVTFIIITWRGIIVAGKNVATEQSESLTVRMLPLIFLLPLYLCFIGLLTASSVTYTTQLYTCENSDERDSKSLSEILAISYKAVFAFYAFVLLIAFLFYGLSIYSLLAAYPSFKETIKKNAIATFFATVSLMILVAITLYTTNERLENTTKLAFIITVLILPSYAIAYLFGYKSTFTMALLSSSKKSKSKKSTTSSADKRTTKGSSSKGSKGSTGPEK
eukprot:TRINITY_DN4574_c0_g1_i2.p1 TRINITY_DN4574_c0_g1~~TRINITY_DN4574_c0_g1_i2.p1  ORF type:complete len:1520 (+),score=303.31 TRINITY_DN4574_c0_g1_i2:418-4560(+)